MLARVREDEMRCRDRAPILDFNIYPIGFDFRDRAQVFNFLSGFLMGLDCCWVFFVVVVENGCVGLTGVGVMQKKHRCGVV